MRPHKHAALIKAWADDTSLTVQCRPVRCGRLSTQWETISKLETITWDESLEYRIKPKTIKYRNWLSASTPDVRVTTDESISSCNPQFIKWLGDWQEVEV